MTLSTDRKSASEGEYLDIMGMQCLSGFLVPVSEFRISAIQHSCRWQWQHTPCHGQIKGQDYRIPYWSNLRQENHWISRNTHQEPQGKQEGKNSAIYQNEGIRREDAGEMVCFQSADEILVDLSEEMAESLMDCPASPMAWTTVLINRKKAWTKSIFWSGSDSISSAIVTTSYLQEHLSKERLCCIYKR